MKEILIIEDNQDIRLFMSNVLKKEGFAVQACGDGLEASKLIQTNLQKNPDFRFDLIILDLIMPNMNGTKFLTQGLNLNDSKMMIISAKNDPTLIKDCIKNGAHDYIIKPIDKDLLYDKVHSLLAEEPEEYSIIDTRFPIYLEEDEQFQGMIYKLSENTISFLGNLKYEENHVLDFICEDLAALTGNDIHFYVTILSIENKGKYYGYTAKFIGLGDSELSKLRILTQSGKEISYKEEEEEVEDQ